MIAKKWCSSTHKLFPRIFTYDSIFVNYRQVCFDKSISCRTITNLSLLLSHKIKGKFTFSTSNFKFNTSVPKLEEWLVNRQQSTKFVSPLLYLKPAFIQNVTLLHLRIHSVIGIALYLLLTNVFAINCSSMKNNFSLIKGRFCVNIRKIMSKYLIS